MTAPITTTSPTITHTLWLMAVAAVLTVVSYASWLGRSDDTSTQQVLGLVATLSVIVAIVTYRLADLGRATIAAGVAASTLTVTFWIDFASALGEDEVSWTVPIAIFVGCAAAVGLATVALLVWSLRLADRTPLVAAVLTVAAYLGCLGWDRQRTPDGSGPYNASQVVGLALTLVIMTAIISRRSTDLTQPLAAIAVATATACEGLDYGSSELGSDGMSTACSWSAASGTMLSTASLVEANTTGAATPSSWARAQFIAVTHQRSPGESPGKPYSGLGVDRSLPMRRW